MFPVSCIFVFSPPPKYNNPQYHYRLLTGAIAAWFCVRFVSLPFVSVSFQFVPIRGDDDHEGCNTYKSITRTRTVIGLVEDTHTMITA